MQIAPQLRLLRKGNILQRPTLRAVRNAYRAVDVDAAQHDHASRRAAEDLHQLFGLRSRTDDQVNYDIGRKVLQFPSAGVEVVTVAPNLVNASGRGRRATVKDRDCVPLLL